ncbi:MAG: hypothetical protein JWM35_2513, partial [Verrucomicrobia bacterium]|nr:hypothetical protein [Verrucomicrobiota bacterium]
AEVDRVYQGKIAEREIFLKKQLNDAYAAQKPDEAGKIQQQMASERDWKKSAKRRRSASEKNRDIPRGQRPNPIWFNR